jgi:uncharacterized delta-60 repeat protein
MRIVRRIAIVALGIGLPALSQGVALAAPADLDAGFGQNGRLTLDSDIAYSLALQHDGKIIVGGEATSATTPSMRDGAVHGLNSSGSPDGTFGAGGAVRLGGTFSGGYAVTPQPDGNILSVGYTANDARVTRLEAGGSFDQGFGSGGSVDLDSGNYERAFALALQPGDGKVLVAGATITAGAGPSIPVVYRLTPGGDLDDGFASGGTARLEVGGYGAAHALAVQPDGKILVAGSIETNGNTNAVVYRLNPDGTPDSSFGRGGKREVDADAFDYGVALARQSDGRIVLVTSSSDATFATGDVIVYRLNANGTPDPSFGQGGKSRIVDDGTNAAGAAALQVDGKIVVAGARIAGNDVDAVVYRLNRNGSPDPGFDGDGALRIASTAAEVADALAVQADGRIVVAGVSQSGLTQRAVVYRLQGGEPVSATPAPPASPTPAASPPGAPVLDRLRITPSTFRAATKGASAVPAARRGGAVVSFKLNRAASVRFAVERAGRGRRIAGRCVRATLGNRAKRSCTRYTRLAGGFSQAGVVGSNRFRFTGRVGGRPLRPAGYRLVATSTADGLRGDAKRVRFRVKR